MSNSLGTLTLDLVARIGGFVDPLRQAEQEASSSFGKMREGINNYGAAVAGTVAAVGAAMVTLTMQTAEQANEITRLSAIAGMSTDAFQEMAAGAKVYGIEQDALADILKDTQEKFGEFIAVEGGGAIDFFEQIAEKTGVAAEEFRALGGADALQLLFTSLEKAGLSMNEMIFHMEAVASGSSQLIPMFRNGGEEMAFFGEEARKAGAILSEETIKSANEMEAAGYMLDLQLQGLKNEIATELMPKLAGLGSDLLGLAKDTGAAEMAADILVGGLRGVIKIAIGASGAVNLLGKTIGGMAAGAGAAFEGVTWSDWMTFGSKDVLRKIAGNKEAVRAALQEANVDIEAEVEKIAKSLAMVDGKSDAERQTVIDMYVKALDQRKAREAEARAGSGTSGSLGKKAADEAKAQADAIAAQMESERQARESLFISMRDSYMSETDVVAAELDRRQALIAEFTVGNKAEYDRLNQLALDWANEQAGLIHEREVQEQISRDQSLDRYRQYFESQEQLINRQYDREVDLIKASTQLSVDEQTAAIEALNIERNAAVANYKLGEEQKLAALRAHTKTAIDLIRERYEFERKAVAADPLLTDSESVQKIDSINSNEQNEIGDLQDGAAGRMGGLAAEMEGTSEFEQLRLEREDRLAIIQEALDAEVLAEEDAAERRLQVERDYAASRNELMLSQGEELLGSMSGIMKSLAGEQSTAYKAMFAIEKGISIARSIMAIQTGIAMAAANPFPMNIGAMASVAAATMNIVTSIQSVKMAGQAHDGIMSVPNSGTWNLEKGERVLTQDTAKRLDSTLESIQSGGSAKAVNVSIQNYGTSKQFDVQQISETEVRIIARDEVAKGAGRAAAADLSNANSEMSKGMGRNYQVERRR